MQETLRRIEARRAAGDQGFTLIELLVVVVIIGVLAGISVPLYMNYTKGAKNKTAQADVRNAITAVEQYYSENNQYPAVLNGNATDAGNLKVPTSTGNTLQIKGITGGYVICGQNSDGGNVYKFDSTQGGSVTDLGKSTIPTCLG